MRLSFTLLFLSISILSYAQSSTPGTIEHDGLTRAYSLFVPDSYDGSEAVPLVLNLHGYGSSAFEQEFYSRIREIGAAENFLVVHPEGTEGPGGNQFWNVGFFSSSIDDVGFLENLIDSLSADYNIDANRVYSTGMSNGGYMSYELACQSDRIAAIASVTGSMTTLTEFNCNPSNPVPVMQIHGTADPTVAYEGSTGSLGIEAVVDYWVDHNNTSTSPVVNAIPDIDPTDGATATHYVYNGGDNGATVEFYKVENGGHTWPGNAIVIGTTCQDFNASEQIWRFFSQFTLNSGLVSTEEATPQSVGLKLFPNPGDGRLDIELTEGFPFELVVHDVNGAAVEEFLLTDTHQSLDLTHLPSGVYFLHLTNETNFVSTKYVKQ